MGKLLNTGEREARAAIDRELIEPQKTKSERPMGTDAKAIIYYGMQLPDYNGDEPDYFEVNEAWQESKEPQRPTDTDYKSVEWDQWRERFKAWEASDENIEIDWSGCDSDQVFYIHAQPLEVSVEWSEQKVLALHDFSRRPDTDKQIKEFCERFGFKFQTPQWHLASLYF